MEGSQSQASPDWYEGLPVVSAEIECDGRRHRITWHRGQLILEDHDALAERALVALGGRPPICVELLEMWCARRDTELLRELLLKNGTLPRDEFARRRARHQAELESAEWMARRTPADSRASPERAGVRERQALERLERERRTWAATLTETLPPRMRRALALSVIADIQRRWDEDGFRHRHVRDAESALTALASPLLVRSARRWSEDLKPYRGFEATARLLAPGEAPTCAVWAGRTIVHATLSLPLSWFTEVWAQGISLIDECFVMSIVDSSPDRARLGVLAVRLERKGWKTRPTVEAPALVTRGAGGHWRLQWL